MALQVETHYFDESNKNEFFRSYIQYDSPELNPGKKKPAVIVCPGGGYNFLSDREDEPLAFQFIAKGCHAFTLHYKIGNGQTDDQRNVLPEALKQFATVVKTIREHSDEWLIDSDKIFIIGASAGAHLCACYSGLWHTKWLSDAVGVESPVLRPNACVLLYPVIDTEKIYELMDIWGYSWPEEGDAVDGMLLAMSGDKHPSADPSAYPEYDTNAIYYPASYVSKNNPPTFIVHAADDFFIYVENTIEYIRALSSHRVSFETHIFEKGGHGFSLANAFSSNNDWESNERTAGWVDLLFGWLDSIGIVKK